MHDLHWMLESHRLDVEEREQHHRRRASWNLPEPVRRSGAYRRRLAALLLALANRLDPLGAAPNRPGWVGQPVRRNGTMAVASVSGLPLHRVGRS
jgi:hypothetical protein